MLQRAITRSSRLLTRSKPQHFNRRFHSASESEAFFSSSSTPPPSAAAHSPPVKPTSRRSIVAFLKFAAISTVTGTLAAAGYATYAYTADEVEEKTKAFRASINDPSLDDSATFVNFPRLIYSSAVAASSRAVDIYLDLRRIIEERMQEMVEPVSDKLLPDMNVEYQQMGVMTLVLDLRGTLIYNEWKRATGWSTYKRPGLDDFLLHMAHIYEIVVYTDDQALDEALLIRLQEKGVLHFLARSATKYQDGKHYRDLSKLNRDPSRIIYLSGHALENCLQPENSIPIKPWKKEAEDTTLLDLIPFLEYVGMQKPDIRPVLASYEGKDIPSEFIQRTKRVKSKQPLVDRFSRRWS